MSMKSTSFPLYAFFSLLVITRRAMICRRITMSGLVISTSTSGLFTWLAKPFPVTAKSYLKRNHSWCYWSCSSAVTMLRGESVKRQWCQPCFSAQATFWALMLSSHMLAHMEHFSGFLAWEINHCSYLSCAFYMPAFYLGWGNFLLRLKKEGRSRFYNNNGLTAA